MQQVEMLYKKLFKKLELKLIKFMLKFDITNRPAFESVATVRLISWSALTVIGH